MIGITREHTIESNLIEREDSSLINESLWIAARMCNIVTKEDKQLIHPKALHLAVFDSVKAWFNWQPGRWRQYDVKVGSYQPPSWKVVPGLMSGWWEDATLPLSIDNYSWDMHVEFESIHPFPDGNGRVGRLLYWAMQMIQGQEPELIKASERQDYYRRLEDTRKVLENV